MKYHQQSVSDTFFISMSTTGIMEAKLLAALSLLLVAGKLTGKQNQSFILLF